MNLSQEEIKARVKEAAEYAGLKPELLQKSPFDLSGGEKRRAAIAGVMAMKPGVLILDEPTAGLDPKGKTEIIQLIINYNRHTGSTIIFVTHSMDDAALVADKVLVMSGGEIVVYDTAKRVFSHNKELEELALSVPEITNLFIKLNKKGFDLPLNVFDVNIAKDALLIALRRRAND